MQRAQVRSLSQVLSGPADSNVFAEDDDPELIRDALPFVLKTYDALLVSDPTNRSLCLAAAEGYVTYAYAFVYERAERVQEDDFQHAQRLRKRAAKLYLRGRNYALRALSFSHPVFKDRLREDPEEVLKHLSRKDVALVYWAAAGWAGAISADRGNMGLMAELSIPEAMMRRALALDEGFSDGAIHEFFITFEGSRSDAMGGSAQRAQEHFLRLVALTEGKKASAYVALASTVAVRKQDYEMFKDLLDKALSIDPDAVPKWRLSNTLARQKAVWLIDQAPRLFVNLEEGSH